MGLFERGVEQSESDADEKKLVDHIRSKVEEVRGSANRIAHESIWMTNIAYVLGYDGVAYNSTTRQFQPVNRATGAGRRSKLHVNMILPSMQNRLARLCKNPPRYDVRPDSNDNDAKEDARLSLNVLESMWEKLSLNQKRILLYMWTQECGHAYVKIVWDPTEGNFMVNPETNERGFEGDVRAEIVSPFEVFPDPMAKTFDEVKKSWLIQCKVRKLDYFKEHYPEKGHLVKEEGVWLLSAQYENRINSMNTKGPSSGGSTDNQPNCAIEMIKYEAPSVKYPNGRMIVGANGILLEDKELPVGEIPFAKFDDIPIGGKYYSEAIVTHARPLQDQYNETIRRRAEWTRKLLAGKYVSARGAGLTQESLNDESGEVILYTPVPNAMNSGAPTPMQVPNIPQYAYQETSELANQFDLIFGISDVSKGTLPSASIPAIGMQLLTEQDDTRIGVMTEMNEHAWSRVGMLILKYVQKFWVLPRKLKFAGKSLSYTVKDVSGESVRNTDVTVIRGSTVPGSKTLKRQDILSAWQQGLLGVPNDPKVQEKVLGMIEFGDDQDLWEEYGLSKAQIARGIDLMESGQLPIADEDDNHAMWIQEIALYKKGDKWESLDPNIQAVFQQCREDHLQYLMKLSNALPPTPEEFDAMNPPELMQPVEVDPDQPPPLAEGAPV